MAVKLIDDHTSPFKPEIYQNSYEVALLALIKEKSKGQKVKPPEAEASRPGSRNVVDLMDALKKSMKSQHSEAEQPPAKKSRGKKAG